MQANDMSGKLRQVYRANTKQAEDNAVKATDPRAKEAWLRIANGYRSLAGNSR